MNMTLASPPRLPAVLVIDDEAGLRDVLAYTLPERGYRVVTACDAEEALRLVRESSFELAVCDIMMPGMQGVELLGAIKKLHPETEVIMATGFATLENAVACMKQGAYDYITKPYEVDHLAALLERALERGRLKKEVGSLENVSRLKSEFIASMSHELRTPLNAIIGYTSLTLDGTFGALSPEMKEALDCVMNNSRDLLSIVNAVLNLSMLNAGVVEIRREDFSASELVRDVAAGLKGLALKKGLALSLSIEGSLQVRGDKAKLRQILVNLVDNAIKFTEKGAVTLAASYDVERRRTVLSVSDTGPGIAGPDLPAIFEDFRQIDGSASRRHGGTGLGLAIAKKLCDKLGYELSVRSQPGEGSVFSLALDDADLRSGSRTPRETSGPCASPCGP